MNCVNSTERIYIVISQTGTLLSRILKHITGADYNHASLGLSSDLSIMYSFGRKNPYNPFLGGFVIESPHYGTFKRFSNTKALVLALDIDADKYELIKNMLEKMVDNKKEYRYNYLGLWLAAINQVYKSEKRYYCSEFVRDVLQKYGIKGAEALTDIVKPIDFLTLPDITQVYSGRLQDYSVQCEKVLVKTI